MGFIHALQGLIDWLGWYILPLIAVLSLIVFIHELGHYLVGRWCGVKIVAFSLGFGPELFARVDRRGTRWRIGALPLGGYVKFLGDEGIASAANPGEVAQLPEADRRRTLAGQPVANRAAIVAAGPIANFLLAIVLFAGIYAAFGKNIHAPIIGAVVPGSAADHGGFLAGDVVKTVDGSPVESFDDMHDMITLKTGIEMSFGVQRGGQELTLYAAPALTIVHGPLGDGRMGQLGIASTNKPEDFKNISCSLPTCFVWGAQQTGQVVKSTFAYVKGLFGGRESVDQVGGLIAVAQIAGAIAKISLLELFGLAAIFSVSVGMMNLLPVPLLDGGHLMYYAYEAIRGRPLSQRVQEFGLRIGIALVAILVIFSTGHDLFRLFGHSN